MKDKFICIIIAASAQWASASELDSQGMQFNFTRTNLLANYDESKPVTTNFDAREQLSTNVPSDLDTSGTELASLMRSEH